MDTNDKLRPLYLARILFEYTDEDHTLTTLQLAHLLEERFGIASHRQTIKSDIALLQQFGFDIKETRSSQNRYNMVSRYFENAELKILIDAVQSSKFITQKKSEKLATKLAALAGKNKAPEMYRYLSVEGRAKTDNEYGYLIIDAINAAINSQRKIAFKYFSYTVKKERKLRHNGETYVVSPYFLVWNGDYYYVLGFSDKHSEISCFRIDRISSRPTILEEAAVPIPESFSINQYLLHTFRMFNAAQETVELICANDTMDSLIDRFGKEVIVYPYDEGNYCAVVSIAISNVFFSWIFGFAGKVKIQAPENIIEEYRRLVTETAEKLK